MDDLKYQELDRLAIELDCEVHRDEPLSKHTNFKIGGPARRLITIYNYEPLSGILRELSRLELPYFVLGKGSNLLVGDDGYPGVALMLEGVFNSAAAISIENEGMTIRSGAGVSLAATCVFARDEGLTGLEFAWQIPGSVGGAVYMNAGAYGGEMKDVVKRVWYMDTEGRLLDSTGEELGFGYRRSAFMDGGKIITSAEFKLSHGDKDEIKARMDELKARRLEKQPYDMPSAGSTFKRPKTGYAAALIEQCGLKGRRAGGAQVSEKHAGFIVNTGGATCKDVLELMGIVRETVFKETGIELEPEVRVIGEN